MTITHYILVALRLTRVCMTTFEQKVGDFYCWLQNNGAVVSDKVCLAEIDGMGTGMLAKQSIAKGERLFSIPKNLLLTRHVNSSVRSSIKNVQWNQLIWTIIIEMRQSESFFAPYLRMLPHNINTARSWNDADKEWLRGTDIFDDICDFNPFDDFLKASKKLISDPKLAIAPPTAAEFFFAADFISSYSFTEPESGEVMMIPMADMLNHSYAHNAHCQYLRNGGMEMVATRNIEKGEQVYNTFGETSNSQLLLKYGFIEQPNPKTYMTIYGNEIEEYLEEVLHFKDMKSAHKYLVAEYKVSVDSSDLDRLFRKLKLSSVDFYVWRQSRFGEHQSDPINDRQKLAASLVQEQRSILTKHIGNFSQS